MPRASGSSKGPISIPRVTNQQDYLDVIGKRDKKGEKDPKVDLDAVQVKELHRASDRDSGVNAHHHSLGAGPNQAAPGNHSHRLIGIWLYRSSDGLHNTSGNYQAIAWTDFKFWDKEYYAKQSNSEVVALKEHVATITYRTSFEGNGTGRRGISFFSNGNQQQRIEVPTLGGGATNTQVADHAFAITLNAGEVIQIQSFQNSGVNLALRAGQQITHMKIIRSHPQKIDVAALSASTVPQFPGPEVVSRQFFLNGSW